MYLLDTSALIDLIKKLPRTVAHLGEMPPAALFASVISQGELMTSVVRVKRLDPDQYREELEKLTRLWEDFDILPVTSTTASAYATIQADLASRGKAKLKINDGWIAATATEHGLTLVTSDGHLKGLTGLVQVEDWRE